MTVRGRNDSRSSQVTPTERPGQTVYVGIPASPGVVIGTLFVAPSAIALDAVLDKASADPDAERAALETAMHALGEEFRMSRNTQASRLPEAIGALYGVNEMILADPDLLGEITHRIYAGQSAAAAVRDTVDIIARQFEAVENACLRTRAEDVRAVGCHILRHLMSRDADRHALPERTILLGKGLGLACLSAIPGEQLAGLICTGGSTLSHGVILARALGIPAVVGVATMPLDQADGREVILDGYLGRVILNPEPAVRTELVNLQQEGSLHTQAPADEHELRRARLTGCRSPCTQISRYGVRYESPKSRAPRASDSIGPSGLFCSVTTHPPRTPRRDLPRVVGVLRPTPRHHAHARRRRRQAFALSSAG